MVQQAVLHASSTMSTSDEGGYSSQQIAAAWAWFEHNGATCITPRRAEALRGAALRRSTHQQPSRFKEEYLVALALAQSASKEKYPGCGVSPASLPPSRHSFHGKPNGHLTESCDIAVRTRFAGLSDQERHLYVDNLLNQMLHAKDSNGDGIGSSLMDEFELESVWREMQQHIAHTDIASYVASCNGTTELRMYAKAEHDRKLAAYGLNFASIQQSVEIAKTEQNKISTANFDYTCQQSLNSAKTEHTMNLAASESGKLSPDDASSHKKLGSSYMHRGNSSHHDNHPHSRSPSKRYPHYRSSTPAPDFLHHLFGFRGGKPPIFCSSISTADSIKNSRLLLPLASKPKGKQEAKLQDSKSLEDCIGPDRMRSSSLVRRDDNGKDEELDHHQYHRHVHHHHHHHHHHAVLHHREDHAMILEQIMSKGGRKGSPILPRPKLLIDGSKQAGALLAEARSHYYFKRSDGRDGHLEKNEYLMHLP